MIWLERTITGHRFQQEDGSILDVALDDIASFVRREKPTGISLVEDRTVHGVLIGERIVVTKKHP